MFLRCNEIPEELIMTLHTRNKLRTWTSLASDYWTYTIFMIFLFPDIVETISYVFRFKILFHPIVNENWTQFGRKISSCQTCNYLNSCDGCRIDQFYLTTSDAAACDHGCTFVSVDIAFSERKCKSLNSNNSYHNYTKLWHLFLIILQQ